MAKNMQSGNGSVLTLDVAELPQVDNVALKEGAKQGKKLRNKDKAQDRAYVVEQAKKVLITTILGSRRGGGGDSLRKAINMALRFATFGDYDSKKTITKYAITAQFVMDKLTQDNLAAALDRLQGSADNEDKVRSISLARSWVASVGVQALFDSITVLQATGTNIGFGGVSMPCDRAVSLAIGRAFTASEGAKMAGF